MDRFDAVILVGHGGIASDTPPELVAELKRLARERERGGDSTPSAREAELDRTIRTWPRSDVSDPYKHGLEAIGRELAPRIAPRRLVVAYNEFCAPSVDDAIDRLVADGAATITLATTMFTPGGSHAEVDIPNLVRAAAARHPEVRIGYAWPYDVEGIAEFLARHLARRSDVR